MPAGVTRLNSTTGFFYYFFKFYFYFSLIFDHGDECEPSLLEFFIFSLKWWSKYSCKFLLQNNGGATNTIS